MPTTLTTNAIEEATYVVTFAFTDEDGDAVTPNAGLKWSLTDTAGNTVNSRTDIAVTAASSVSIVLSGDDLAISSGYGLDRVITVEGTYNSSYGTNLPLKEQAQFTITPLLDVP